MRVEAISWPRVELWPDRALLRTAAPLSVRLDGGRIVLVPGGMWSDGASVPNACWALLKASPLRLVVMGIVHDFAVRRDAALHHADGTSQPFTVESATDLAVEVARYHGVEDRDRYLIGAALWAARRTYWQQKDLLWTPAPVAA